MTNTDERKSKMTNEQAHILIEAIKIITEDTKKKKKLLKKLDRLQKVKTQQKKKPQ